MSDAGGTDNPAFSNADECIGTSVNHENSCTESLQQHENNTDNKLSPTSNGRSFVSQHYVEPTRNSPEAQYKTETRIEVPGEEVKTPNNGKANGVHGNGNNNDVSFLNTSATSVQNNDGKKEQIEAVNLELVSMRPYTANNLQTKGQEACELPNDPYEEYFVPVNEHRKYISSSPNAEIETTVAGVRFDLGPGVGREGLSLRDPTAGLVDYSHWLKALRGEKLYVTKDKRSKSSYWRRIGCWIFGLTVLTLALVIAILAATGVILTQEATKPLENDQPRLLGDVNAAGSQEFIKNPPASPPPETSSFPPWQTTDESTMKIVPEALDGSIWLDNLAWSDDFMDVKSRVYRSVASEIEDTLKDMLHPSANSATVKVYNITSNGQVMFRISYPPTPEPEMLRESIEKTLRQNGNMIGKYHLNRMNIKRLIDECEYNTFNCFTSCKFDYTNGVFGCACLPGERVDASGNNCIGESDLSDVNMDSDDSRPTTVKDVFQGRSQAPDYSFESRGHDDQMHHLYHNHHNHNEHDGHGEFVTESSSKSEPKPTTEPKSKSEPMGESKSEPEPVSEPASEPKSEPEPVSEPTSEPKSELEPANEPTSDSKSEHESSSEPISEQKSEPDPVNEPTSEPKSEPEPVSEPTSESKSEPEPASEPTSEPNSEPESSSESTSEPKSEPEPAGEPISDSTTQPESEPDSSSKPTAEPESETEALIEPESYPNFPSEAALEPKPEDESTTQSIVDHSFESDSKIVPKSEPDPIAEPKWEPQSTVEPTSEAEPKFESGPESKSEPQPTTVSSSEPARESNPNPEPTSEPESVFASESSIEPENEPESTPEPESITEESMVMTTMKPEPKSSVEPITTQEPEAVTEPIPTVEPLAVIPLISADEKTKYTSPSEDSTIVPTIEERMQTTQEVPEMLPTAIPKTSVLQSHHDEYEERTNSKFPLAAQDEETIIQDFTTIESLTTTEIDSTNSSEEQSTESDLKDSFMDFMSTMPEFTTTDSNESDNFETTTYSNILDMDSTASPPMSGINHTLAQLTPESIDPYALIHNVLGINVTTESPVKNSSVSKNILSVIPVNDDGNNNTEKPIETITLIEEKHADDMSPFLPDVVREKETSKKAPRLDKDEQDFPNPFEPHVEDVIVHHHAKTESTMTSNNNANGTEFTDLNNDAYLSHDAHQTGTTREEDVGMLDMVTTVTSAISMTEVPGNVDVIDLEQKHIDDMNSKRLTNDTDDERGNNADFNDNKTSDDIYVNIKHNKNVNAINSVSEKIHEELSDEDNKTSTINNKFEDNVEDQYNDINDENISKKFDVNQEEKSKLPNENSGHVQVNKDVMATTPKFSETTGMSEDVETTMDTMVDAENIKTTTSEPTSMRLMDDNKFTTEMPIMPMEIQEDITTTEMSENTNPTVMDVTENIVTDSPMTITTQMSMTETKTTAQVPILPDELQTTEATTTEKISINVNVTSELLPSSTESVNHMRKNYKTTMVTDIPEITTVSDIKPVSEMIADDPVPVVFDTKPFLTTTEQVLLTNPAESDDNVDDEKLKVISLDDEYQNEDAASHESHEKNRFDYPKLKIFEITAASKSPEIKNPVLDTTSATSTMNPITKIMTPASTTAPTPRQTPEIIPVYEPIEENEENPIFKPLHLGIDHFQITNMTMNHENRDEVEQTMNPHMTSTVPNPTINIQNAPKPFMFSKCNAGQFQCTNGTSRDGAYCVNLSSKCDSENDCSDGSDELNCEDAGCPGNFQCRSGQCLGRHLVCNGIGDCDDSSDEEKCDEWMCQFDEFKCPNGRCIPEIWRCNGRPDCEDHRDEYSCSKSCGNDEYLCPTENWCIPQTWRCNGVPECANGEDEKLCDCALDQFKCQTGGCVASNQVCDGIEHCPDLSDEWDCLIANISMENISQIQNSNEETAGAIGQQPMLLKIKQSDNERYMVCTDNWNKNVSDTYCRSLGYFGSETTQTLAQKNEGKKFLRLKENYRDYDWNFVSYLEISDSCQTGEVVKISCQEFSCGSEPDNEGPTARLVGGTPAGEGQWSSVALLKEMKNGAACTASVLGPMHALASYSCIHKYRQSDHWELYLGRDLQKSIRVKNIIPYPQVKYNQFLYDNDIALIQLEQPFIFSRNISAVCLPSQQLQPRALCVTAGWGFPTNGDINLKLNFLPIPIYNMEECNATNHYDGFITKSNICAGFTGTDKGTCYNDEGAPLMCATETGRWEIQGLLSHHSRCSRGHPAIYSSLGPAISWLQHLIPALQIRT